MGVKCPLVEFSRELDHMEAPVIQQELPNFQAEPVIFQAEPPVDLLRRICHPSLGLLVRKDAKARRSCLCVFVSLRTKTNSPSQSVPVRCYFCPLSCYILGVESVESVAYTAYAELRI